MLSECPFCCVRLRVCVFLLCASVSPALAQNRAEFPVEGGAVIVEGDGNVNIVIEQDGVRIFTGHPATPMLRGLLPSDEELVDVRISDELRTLVAQLDHPEYRTRQRAMQEIIDLRSDNLPIYALLVGKTLSAEQHLRLLAAVRERLLNAPRGALGISMPRERLDVEIIDLIPGLPAEKVLQIGDRIIAIDDQAIHTHQDLTMLIQMRRPGEQVMLTIERPVRDEHNQLIVDEDGLTKREEMDVTLTLGSAKLLRDPATGRMQVNPQVVQRRQMEANAAERRFQLEPTRITLTGEVPIPQRTMMEQQLDDVLARHPAIRFLMRYREQAESRGERLDPTVLQQTLNILRMELNDPRLSPEDRTLLQQVIEQYVELMVEP